ncbi:MAG: DNA gyrase subunit B, partial [Clostridiales bacterium]|nr:DNA gyrase subunit B [Clostridiales bacterium]
MDTEQEIRQTPQPDDNQPYDESQIQVLEGLEAVRKRPGMYIGSTGPRGLHHLVYEIVDNSIDEALAGYCTHIDVDILPGDIISVRDNGRGIPIGIQEKVGLPAVTVVLTVLHAGGKFGGSGYKVSGGLHGVGSSVVNALSEWLEVEVSHEGQVYAQRFERGKPVNDLTVIGSCDHNGTLIRFKADAEIFTETTEYEFEILQKRLREQAFLNAGLSITLRDRRQPDATVEENYCYEGGISSFVEFMNRARGYQTLHPQVIHISVNDGDSIAEVALQYNDSYNEIILSFANNIHTVDGGTHETAFKTAITRIFNDYARKHGLLKEGDNSLKGDDVREGLTAVISVKLKEAQFEGQTKAKLGNTAIGTLVNTLLNEKLAAFMEENPAVAKAILEKSISASRVREAAQRARELARKKSGLASTRMPEKLADCIWSDAERTELYIVEGDSAGGSAIQGRDRNFQAILPLWGKMLNVEKARLDKVYGNEKLIPIVVALGCGIGEDFDLSKLRYGKVIIMADADVDGSHIRTLLLT